MSVAARRAIVHPIRACSHAPTAWAGLAAIAAKVVVRSAVAEDAAAIHALIVQHAAEGRLLPRSVDEIATHIDRFIVATLADEGRGPDRVRSVHVVGCADLAPLSSSVAEIRSLVVDGKARANGVGRELLGELTARARAAGFDALCAFTHASAYFVHSGFSLVPHAWLPEKIEKDCRSCPLFRRCGQSAMVLPLATARHASTERQVGRGNDSGDASRIAVPVASVHG